MNFYTTAGQQVSPALSLNKRLLADKLSLADGHAYTLAKL